MSALILVVLFTVGVSCLCSLFESTLYSTRNAALEAVKAQGHMVARANRMSALRRDIGLPISAILVVNTVANTGGASLAGMYADQVLGAARVPVFSLCLTLCILIFAEILPKTLGAVHWRRLWSLIVWPVTVIQWLLYPFLLLIQGLTALISRGQTAPAVTEEDILGALRLGAREGEITEWESRVAHNIIALEDKRVHEIMTPRTVLFQLDASLGVRAALQEAARENFTRIPVYGTGREDILGYVTLHDLALEEFRSTSPRALKELMKPIAHVPKSMNCALLLTQFLRGRLHIAMVVDEYGGLAGVVTLEDLLETALGTEIVDENDMVADLQELARSLGAQRIRPEKNNSHTT